MSIKDAVMTNLINNTNTRNNDTLLCAEVYKMLGLPSDLDELSQIKKKPSLATIIRWRRKIQEYNPHLCAEMKVRQYRETQKLEHLDIARLSALDVKTNG